MPLQVGQKVSLRGRQLFGSTPAEDRLLLRLSGAGISLKLSTQAHYFQKEQLKKILLQPVPSRTQALLTLLVSPPDTTENRLTQTMASRFRKLSQGLFQNTNHISVSQSVGSLAGLGPGSTPSGDDLLLGTASVVWRLRAMGLCHHERASLFFDALQQIDDTQTTPLSRAMLSQASRGHFSQPLVLLVQAIGNQLVGSAELKNRIRHLAQVGGHSGCDMLAGVLGTIRAYLTQQEGVVACTKM